MNHLRRLAEIAAEPFIGDDADATTITRLAGHVERACRQLVRGNRRELQFVSVVPHPELNTAAARANRIAHLMATIVTISPINRIQIPIRLEI